MAEHRLVYVDDVDKLLERHEDKYRKAGFTLTAKEIAFARQIISEVETVDAEPVVHAHWIIHSSGHGDYASNWAECSECRVCGSPQWKRCPACEAKMDGGADHG